jgi:hypothetical protein
MNQSRRFSTLAAAAAALASQMALASGANAAIVPIIHDFTLTGIDGLDVDGTDYNVRFVAATRGAAPPIPEFATLNDAARASRVLGRELETLEDGYLSSDTYLPIEACPRHNSFDCGFITPDKSAKAFGAELGFVANIIAAYSVTTLDQAPRPHDSRDIGYDYAVWTSATTVPEPSPIALLGVGMAGLAAARAVRGKKKSA